IAAQLHPQQGAWPELRSAAIRSEALGYDILYTWDHFSPLYGNADGPHFECWSLLAAWAECTSRVELGPLVACNSYRNPSLHADIARTIDHISGGRVIMGLGAGWFERDYRRYGYEFGTRASRIRALGRATPEIIERLATLSPPPLRPMPILIAGVGLTLTLPIVARHADAWHAFFPDTVEEVRPAVDALIGQCAAIGRDPYEIEWSVGLQPDDIGRFLREDADRYLEMGFTQFTLGFNGPEWRVEGGAAFLEWRDRMNAERGLAIPA
ncbi:MAG TPA: LLM class F420-dependent oxidoreductase, partial [Pleomorphomonadaceae bacterium]|nr:LLM class F420-dependent oxidoreductase [Pleomorphomonadaceae bacterium]